MKRSDITTQQVFSISQFTKISCATSSKGNLTKYSNGSQWLKTDAFGYESLAEIISSRVGVALGLNIVKYKPCFLDTENEFSNLSSACFSDSFVPLGYNEISLGRLLQQLAGSKSTGELYDLLEKQGTPANKVNWVYSLINRYFTRDYFMHNIAELLWFDRIIYNTDRHLFNIILLLNNNTKEYTFAPIFDCGASLLSDLQDYPVNMPISIALRDVKSKPFSTSFDKQIKVFQSYLKDKQIKDIYINIADLVDYYDTRYIQRALKVLEIGLSNLSIMLHIKDEASRVRTTKFFEI